MRRRVRTILLASVALLALASALTWPRPPQTVPGFLAGAQVEPAVRATLERSCGDCHSFRTRYPWYSYVAPVSWLVRNDVLRGREHLNFSMWDQYPVLRRERCLSEIANQVRDGEMPLPMYTFMHHGSKLSKEDADAVFRWTQVERARLITENLKLLPAGSK